MSTHRNVTLVAACSLACALLLTGCENPPNPLLRKQAADAIYLNQIDVAEKKLTRALERDGADWKAAMLLGEVRLKQGRPLDAQLMFERALAHHNSFEEAPRILDGLAESLYQQQEFERLQVMLTTTARERWTTADFLRQARYLAKLGDPDGARLAFRKAARFADPTDTTPYLRAADYYESIGDTEAAITALRRTYRIVPDSPQIAARLRNLGHVPGPTTPLPPEHIEDEELNAWAQERL